jgi:hypothetical protein
MGELATDLEVQPRCLFSCGLGGEFEDTEGTRTGIERTGPAQEIEGLGGRILKRYRKEYAT